MTVNRSLEELEMRALIVPELRRRWPTARIIHELPTRYSSNRIDLAAVTPDMIVAVEIKSSRDVIDRLEAQLRAFYPITGRLIVALAPVWNEKLPPRERVAKAGRTARVAVHTEAEEVIRRVGRIDTWTCDATQGRLDTGDTIYGREAALRAFHLEPHRKPWAERMLDILHVAELEQIAAQHCIATGRRPNHHNLVQACHDAMRGPEIVRAVCRALRIRDAFAAGTDAPIVEQVAA